MVRRARNQLVIKIFTNFFVLFCADTVLFVISVCSVRIVLDLQLDDQLAFSCHQFILCSARLVISDVPFRTFCFRFFDKIIVLCIRQPAADILCLTILFGFYSVNQLLQSLTVLQIVVLDVYVHGSILMINDDYADVWQYKTYLYDRY